MFIPYKENAQRIAILSLGILYLAAIGCSGGPPTGVVTGKVTFNGEPVAHGIVTFYGDDGRVDSSQIDDGNYTVHRAPVGPVKITVTGGGLAPGGMGPPGMKMGKEMSEKLAEKGGAVPEGKAAARLKDPKQIPRKYGAKETSDLTFTVKKGTQSHDIDLKP
jgi:hypothetical protein